MKKIYILFCCFTILSCGKEKGTNNNDNVDRAAILDNLGNIIFERYTTFKESADSLNIFADSFQNHTNEANLIALRNAYIKTYKDFQKIQYFNFAKALELNIIDAFNFYPEDSTIILNAIQSNIYNIQTISNKAKGLQALDYLLFGIRSYSDAELISWYNATPNAKTYLVNITQEISRISNLIYNDWNTSYLSTFKTRQGIDRSSSFFLLTNALIENFERNFRNSKVGIPLGYYGTLGGSELIEARYSKNSIQLIKTYLTSLEEFLNGKNGLGYDDYLNTINARYNDKLLSTTIQEQIANIHTKIDALEEPFADEIVNDNQKVKELFQAIQSLVITLKVDVSLAMSIEIIYQDTDGD